MARQIIPIDRVVKCHVNSLDSSPTYESGVAYAAGTLVNYNGDSYTAIIDIADDDSDTPVDATEKWALTPNAFRSSGDSGLGDRVAALEEEIDGKYLLKQKLTSLQVKGDGVKTVKDLLDELSAAFTTAAAALDDTEMIEPLALYCSGYAWCGAVGTNYVTNQTTSFNIAFDRSVVSSGALYHYVAMFADAVNNQNKLSKILEESTPAITITDVLTDVPATNATFEIQFRIWEQA